MFIENSGRYESEIAYLLWNGYGSMWRRKQMSLFDWSCDEITKFVFWQIWVETNKPWRPLNRFTAAGDRNDQINGQMTLRGKGGQINMQYIFTLDKQLLVLQRSKLAYAVLAHCASGTTIQYQSIHKTLLPSNRGSLPKNAFMRHFWELLHQWRE